MADGRIHAIGTQIGAVSIAMVTYHYTNNLLWAFLSFSGCIFGLFLTPDLDQPTITWVESQLLKSKYRLVRILGHLFIAYWLPYAHRIPHRHLISHAPIIGTLVRLLYIAPIIIPFLGILWVYGGQLPLDEIMIFIGGLVTSDILHWLGDTKTFKKILP